MARYDLPTLTDLRTLDAPHQNAITIYAQTSPAPDQRDAAHLSVKSAFDAAIRELREAGIRHNDEQALRDRWEKVRTEDIWTSLSQSLAVFIADDVAEVFVLPNRLENQTQVGAYFDLGQLVRAVTTPQSAYALTLSGSGWNLWRATATTVATEVELSGEHAVDVADATNRATIRDRAHVRRLVGDEGKKVLLEKYAKRVAEAVKAEVGQLDPNGTRPFFLFATDPLVDMYQAADPDRQIVAVHGSPDELRADEIDAALRPKLAELNAAHANSVVEGIADGTARGLVATDLVDISRAATAGAVGTLVYDFTVDVLGAVDDATGDLTFDDNGYDLLSRIALTVLDRGGDVIAVRPDEVTADAWPGTAIAGLRHALS